MTRASVRERQRAGQRMAEDAARRLGQGPPQTSQTPDKAQSQQNVTESKLNGSAGPYELLELQRDANQSLRALADHVSRRYPHASELRAHIHALRRALEALWAAEIEELKRSG